MYSDRTAPLTPSARLSMWCRWSLSALEMLLPAILRRTIASVVSIIGIA
ncbi:MAG: hypothetical protein GIKADHBN_01083 [Phycisphaerales bacterium]|nr:hypothetical protein [Phycisphaerales bacterium]